MTNEKMLELINKAIENLGDEGDGYGMTPVEYMRQNAIKSVDDMRFFTDSIGAYLEELRLGVLADIEAAEAKKNGKSSILSAVKKMSKLLYSKMSATKPYLAYAHYDEQDKKYWMCDGHWMIISETLQGMTLCPEAIAKDVERPFNYKASIPETYNMYKYELPPIGKLSAYLKQAKAKTNVKKNSLWDKITIDGETAVKGEWLELFMRITGARTLYYKGLTAMCMEGQGYKVVLMPVKNKENEPPTDFDNI